MITLTIELEDDTLANIRKITGPIEADIAYFIADYLTTHLSPDEEFTPEQIATIEIGLDAVAEGRVVPHEKVMAEIDRILSLKAGLKPDA
jgi:predicted transcriptional regulator